MTRAAIYIRVSTKGQTTEQQLEPCYRYADLKEWSVVQVVDETSSAYTGPRTKWEALKADIRKGKVDAVLVFRFDRAWRRSADMVLDVDDFTRRGVIVASVMEGLDSSTPFGRAMIGVLASLAELERTFHVEASKERLAALKNLHVHLGRPLGGDRKHELKLTDAEILAHYRQSGAMKRTADALGISVGKVHSVVHNAAIQNPPPKTESAHGRDATTNPEAS